jgi:hypothetical protein
VNSILMHHRFLGAPVFGLAIIGCLSLISSTAPCAGEEPVTAMAGEVPGWLETERFVPAAWMGSQHHELDPRAWHDGLNLQFQLRTRDGLETVHGMLSLGRRLRELNATVQLGEVSRTEAFGQSLVRAGQAKVESVSELVKDPVGTVKRIPKGAARFFGRIKTAVEGAGSGEEEVDAGKAAGKVIGMDRRKAEISMQLGVTPYTTDAALQEQLTSVARAMALGGFTLNSAGMLVGGGLGTALTAVNMNETLQRALVESTAAELLEMNREKLIGIGASPLLVEQLQRNPWFNPWEETKMVDTLTRIGTPPDVFLAEAVNASSFEDADYFSQLALLFDAWRTRNQPVLEYRLVADVLCGLDTAGTLVVPVSADMIAWTLDIATKTRRFSTVAEPNGEVKSLVLITDGNVTPAATRNFESFGARVNALYLGAVE